MKTCLETASSRDTCLEDNITAKLRCLLQSPVDESTTQHLANDFAKYFTNKIDKIRLNSASAPPPLVVDRNVLNQLSTFIPVTPVEIMTLLSRSPAKQCTLDPIPTWLLKQVSAIMSPVIAAMCNASLKQQVMPADQRWPLFTHFSKSQRWIPMNSFVQTNIKFNVRLKNSGASGQPSTY